MTYRTVNNVILYERIQNTICTVVALWIIIIVWLYFHSYYTLWKNTKYEMYIQYIVAVWIIIIVWLYFHPFFSLGLFVKTFLNWNMLWKTPYSKILMEMSMYWCLLFNSLKLFFICFSSWIIVSWQYKLSNHWEKKSWPNVRNLKLVCFYWIFIFIWIWRGKNIYNSDKQDFYNKNTLCSNKWWVCLK